MIDGAESVIYVHVSKLVHTALEQHYNRTLLSLHLRGKQSIFVVHFQQLSGEMLIFCDYYTKWTKAYAIPDRTAQTITDCLVTELVLGYPK